MTNAELVAALKDAEMYMIYIAPNCYASCEAIKAIRAAADALEECMKKENALRSLIDGRSDPVSCNVDAILKGEYE